MPILHEGEDEIVVARDWPLNWLFRPTRIRFDTENRSITWQWFLFPHRCTAADIDYVDNASKYAYGPSDVDD